ncbi:protein seele [Phymastichus coffea]|uniref:protein seele n=1 Tax=Phymastichus coffea TaxID=108790 RepID=UPI00273B6099|nr:protein seele [Phymastichus coffea]
MKSIIIFSTVLLLSVVAAHGVNLKQVKCLVCRTVVDEFKHEVNKIDPKKNIEIGQYRLDSKGNAVQRKVPLALSEVHLSDMLDSICKKMDDYVRATYKSNGKLTLLKLITDEGMNPLMGEVDIIQDGDLNKSLGYFCTDIVNEHEDTFIEVISKKEKNAKDKICTEVAEYCGEFTDSIDTNDDDDESDDTEEKESQDYDKTEL